MDTVLQQLLVSKKFSLCEIFNVKPIHAVDFFSHKIQFCQEALENWLLISHPTIDITFCSNTFTGICETLHEVTEWLQDTVWSRLKKKWQIYVVLSLFVFLFVISQHEAGIYNRHFCYSCDLVKAVGSSTKGVSIIYGRGGGLKIWAFLLLGCAYYWGAYFWMYTVF